MVRRGSGLVRRALAAVALVAVVAACNPPSPTPALDPVPPDLPPPEGSPTLGVDRQFVTGLGQPWDMGFLPNGTMFFTEKHSGLLQVRFPTGVIRTIAVVDDSLELNGLAVDPRFAAPVGTPGRLSVYTCTASDDADAVEVTRWTLSSQLTSYTRRTDILSADWPSAWNIKHGCRIRFRPDTNELWVTVGDMHLGTAPQNIDHLAGKILRITRDGAPYPGNPFGTPVYTYGHRNPQGIAFQPGTNAPYAIEHGPDADDEVNLLVPGGNGGWDPGNPYPDGFGAGVPMTDLKKFPDAMRPAWRSGLSTIAPSGGTFLEGAQWGAWDGALAVACLKGKQLRVMFLGVDGKVTSTTTALTLDTRLRSAVQGPDGSLYIATDVGDGAGAIWRVTPQ